MVARVLSFGIWLIASAAVGLSMLAMGEMSIAAATQFRTGLIPERDEVYRSFNYVPFHRAYLPPGVDLSPRFPTPGFQGEQGSCVAWSLVYAVLSYHDGGKHGWQFTSPDRLLSPAYLYNQLVRDTRNCDRGTRISEALHLLRDDGVVNLELFPYDTGDCSRLPTATMREAGRAHRIHAWQVIEPGDLDSIKGQLYKGHPVVFGLYVTEAFMTWQGAHVYADLSVPRTLLHAMVFVGYDEQRQAFRAINSWGTTWGDHGFVWIHYDVVKQFVRQMYVIDVGVPPKPPPPTGLTVAAVHGLEPVPVPPPPSAVPSAPAPSPGPTPSLLLVPSQSRPDPHPVGSTVPPEPVKPLPPIAEVHKRVTDLLRRVECGSIEATLTPDRVVRMRGFVGSRTHLDALRQEITRLPGVAAVGDEVALRPWPQCEVYLTFGEVLAAPRGLTMQVRGANTLHAGESLVVELISPAFPSYVYLAYLQASGEAVHLAWPYGKSSRPIPPNTRLVFGDPGAGGPRFRIQAPFGDEMLIALASSTPLFTGDPSTITGDRTYLTMFRQTLLARHTARSTQPTVVGAVMPLVTQARN